MAPELNTDAAIDFLTALLKIHSPTGRTVEAVAFVRRAFEALGVPGLTAELTPKGALVMTVPGKRDDAPRALTAHVDTLGLMVKEIKPSGRLKATLLGGGMWNAVEFEGVTVETHEGRLIRGTVLPSNPSVHVSKDVATAQRTEALMEVRLDARTTSAAETHALGIEVGDFILVDPRIEVTDTGFIRSRYLDDKLSVACIYAALQALAEAGEQPAQRTTILISNYEEVGHGGTGGLPADLAELVAVDMAALGDGQASDEFHCTLCVKDSGGPYDYALNRKLRALAAEADVDLKIDVYPFYSSDGTAYWRGGGQGRVSLIGPGVDASHAYERTHRDSIAETARLIAAYLKCE
ncbi:MAG TPA: M42 family metallopeptidase [Candidatus Limnocylindrales bacterium]|nr:M42 family metallopeptidase [Candidatus Limnocylindrales bacterium]